MNCITVINDTDIFSGFSFRGSGMGVNFNFLNLNDHLGNQIKSPERVLVDRIENELHPYYDNSGLVKVSHIIYQAYPAMILNSPNIVDLIKPPETRRKSPEKDNTLLVYWAMWQKSETYGAVTNITRDNLTYHQVSVGGDWFEILFTLKTGAVATIYFEKYAINLSNNRGVPHLGHLYSRMNH